MSAVADRDARLALLRSVPVFAELSDEDLMAVASVAVARRFDAGDAVFLEGDSGDSCYVVSSGLARAVRQNQDGRSITLAHFTAGDMFGELAMFGDEPRSATVDTLEPTEVIVVPRRDVQRLIRQHPEIAVKLMASLAQRLRATNERLARQSFQTVQSRVAAVLVQLAVDARADAVTHSDVVVTLTQADLAKLAGSSRESASRFLATLERSGVITQGRGRLTIHDPKALERYVY
ncbi:MAG: Crp/Fnr family transcriptional regulator [Solirubrobacteraceae bacterium]